MDEQHQVFMTCCICKVTQLESLQQLSCLHSCCTPCGEREAASVGGVTCSICQETTERAVLQKNLFLAGHARFLKVLSGRCETCSSQDGARQSPLTPEWEEADSMCFDCMTSMCTNCLREHERIERDHNIVSWKYVQSGSGIEVRCFPLCREHGESFSRACLTCDTLQCRRCDARHFEEAAGRHEVHELGSAAVRESVLSAKDKMCAFSKLRSRFVKLQGQDSDFRATIDDYRKKSLTALEQKKKCAIDAIENEYSAAKAKLFSECDATTCQAEEHAHHVKRWQQRLASAESYCGFLVDYGIDAAVICQRGIINARFQQLERELERLESSGNDIFRGNANLNGCVSAVICQRGIINARFQQPERELERLESSGNDIFRSNANLNGCGSGTSETGSPDQLVTLLTGPTLSPINDRITHPCVDKEDQLERQSSVGDFDLELASTLSAIPSVMKSRVSSPTGSSISMRHFEEPLLSLKADKKARSPQHSPRDTTSRKRQLQKRPFVLKCGGPECATLVVASENLRLIGMKRAESEPTDRLCWHHVVIDHSFVNRVFLKPHYNPASIGTMQQLGYDVYKVYKIWCKNCRKNDWGCAVRISEKLLFFLKCDTLSVDIDGEISPNCLNWIDFPYHTDYIRDRQLLSIGTVETAAEILPSNQDS